jgi:hypothetical protein
MFTFMVSAPRTLESCAQEFDTASLTAADAMRAVDELGAIRRVVDGMLARGEIGKPRPRRFQLFESCAHRVDGRLPVADVRWSDDFGRAG